VLVVVRSASSGSKIASCPGQREATNEQRGDRAVDDHQADGNKHTGEPGEHHFVSAVRIRVGGETQVRKKTNPASGENEQYPDRGAVGPEVGGAKGTNACKTPVSRK